jgi:hypothetical protein
MVSIRTPRTLRPIPYLIAVCLIALPANAQYSGGTGEPNDPYQIATAADLIALGETPEDYDKHFILTADIDLDPNLPGRKVFDRAVVAPDVDPNDEYPWFNGALFTGTVDGKGHAILGLTITGKSYLGLFGQIGFGASVSNLGMEAVDINGISDYVGGLVGHNQGSIVTSHSGGSVRGRDRVGGLVGDNLGGIAASYSSGSMTGRDSVGGLVGHNWGSLVASYSSGSITGRDGVGGLVGYNWDSLVASYSSGSVSGNSLVGGLVGSNGGSIATSYSTGLVSGTANNVGGLVGSGRSSDITSSFWDTQTSGQTASAGGTGQTTAEMQTAEIFLEAGWDFVGEVANGTCDYWQILPGGYPQLCCERGSRPLIPEGLGTPGQPYLIRDALDLGTVWFEPLAHYHLAQSINLSGITWATAVVPWFGGTLGGDGYVISNLHIQGGGYLGLFGYVSSGASVAELGLEAVHVDGTGGKIGGLGGYNYSGRIDASYSSGCVNGGLSIGGLVGENSYGHIASSFSSASVSGDFLVGGLVGENSYGHIAASYSSGSVSSDSGAGGLVGDNFNGIVNSSFWDIQTSGRATSDGGTGKTTAEMQTAKTFLNAGWDFMAETANGTVDTWGILDGRDYPRLAWEFWAFSPDPWNGDDVIQFPIVRWRAAKGALAHDVYFGEDEIAVASATPASLGIYRGRQPAAVNTYDPGILEWSKTYYWRIDEVNDADPNSPWKGSVWRFTTADYIMVSVVDDFESYTDDMNAGQAIFQTWLDSYGYPYASHGTGSFVGYMNAPFAEQAIVHGGRQSMPVDYNNVNEPWYSEAERAWESPQDWSKGEADTLTLYFRGEQNNSPEPLYVGIEDGAGQIAVVVHPDAYTLLVTEWQKWQIELADLQAAGVDVAAVKMMVIGVGDRNNPQPGGTGRIYIDDIRLTKRMP